MDSFHLLYSAAIPLHKMFPPAVIWLLVFAAALSLAVAFLRTPLAKGWLGELAVNLAARLLLDKRRFHLIRNVTLPSGDGTTQIDHVIISRHGVFVVETKNMSGWIFGAERDAKWTQKFRKSSHTFQNPLRQNYKHTLALVELLGVSRDTVKSIVVFVGGGQFKKGRPAGVMTAIGCMWHIRSHKQELLSEDDVQRMLTAIESHRLAPTATTHRRHVEHVKKIVAAKDRRKPSH